MERDELKDEWSPSLPFLSGEEGKRGKRYLSRFRCGARAALGEQETGKPICPTGGWSERQEDVGRTGDGQADLPYKGLVGEARRRGANPFAPGNVLESVLAGNRER